MKLFVATVLFLSGLVAFSQTDLKKFERVVVAGSDYVRLSEWADDHDFNLKWQKKNDLIEVSGTASKLEFNIDSRKCLVGGVAIWLSMPVINRNGVAFVSAIDVQTTLDPILFPRKSSSRIKTICLDPGHGGKDKGKIDGQNYEKNYTLLLAKEVADLLKAAGFKVILTRTKDEYVELSERSDIAHRNGADLFVSLHYNDAPSEVRGVEVYCLTPAGMNSSNEGGGKSARGAGTGNAQDERNIELAYLLQKSLTKSLPLEDRGMKRSRFEVLREARMPAILIEGGFMSNLADAKNIYDSGFRKRVAQAVVNGIVAYQRALD